MSMRGSRVLSEGVQLNFNGVFWGERGVLIRGEKKEIPLKAGHHWPASETPFRTADIGPT